MAKQSSHKRRIRPATDTKAIGSDRNVESKSEKKNNKLKSAFKPFWVIPVFIGRHFIPRYFKNSFKELRNVTWPSRKQSRQLTLAVIIFAVVFAFFVSIVDLGLGKLFKRILLKG